jgi:hypothetical protein
VQEVDLQLHLGQRFQQLEGPPVMVEGLLGRAHDPQRDADVVVAPRLVVPQAVLLGQPQRIMQRLQRLRPVVRCQCYTESHQPGDPGRPLDQGDGRSGEFDGFRVLPEVECDPAVEGQRLGPAGAVPHLLEQRTCPPEVQLRRLEIAEIPEHEADAQRQARGEARVVRPGLLGQLVGGERLGEASSGSSGVAEVREQ